MVDFAVPFFRKMSLSMCLSLHCVIVFQAIVLYMWWLSVMVEVVIGLESSSGQHSLHLRVDGPNVWCVMSTVEGFSVVNQVLFAFQRGPH